MLTGMMNMLVVGVIAALAFLVYMGARDALRGRFWMGLPSRIPADPQEDRYVDPRTAYVEYSIRRRNPGNAGRSATRTYESEVYENGESYSSSRAA